MAKRTSLIIIDFLYALEGHVSRLWQLLSHGQASYWFDPVPAWFYVRRKNAERRHFRVFHETIYGQPLTWTERGWD